MDPLVPGAFEDGLGRRHAIDSGGEPVEVLTVRQELAAASSFEFAVRERATRLASFRRPCFAHVRSVERVETMGSTLAVVSERVDGLRLSHLLGHAARHGIALDIDTALCLVRQLVQAMALLHENAPDVSHGALAPERIIVTPQARLVVADYVFGAALHEINFSRERYWTDLRIALPSGAGAPRLDRRADVAQIGTVALAVLLGRPLGDADYPARIPELLEQLQATTPGGQEPLSPGLRLWLSSALHLDRSAFGSAVDAGNALERVLSESDYTASPAALKTFLAQAQAAGRGTPREPNGAAVSTRPATPAAETPPSQPITSPAVSVVASPAAPPPATAPSLRTSEPARTADAAPPQAAPAPRAAVAPPPPAPTERARPAVAVTRPPRVPSVTHVEGDEDEVVMPPRSAPWSTGALIGMAVVLIALTSGVTFATWHYLSTTEVTKREGTLVVRTTTPGVLVVIDGLARGRTPVTANLAPGEHLVELVTDDERRPIPVTIAAGETLSQFLEMAPADTRVGRLFIRTEPAGADVRVDGQLFGASPLTVDGLAPGVHTVTVGEGPRQVTEEVTVEANATASLVVPLATTPDMPTPGWIAVATPVEVQVYQNQSLIGTSRTSRIMMLAGRHQLSFVNESLGYRSSHTVEVQPGTVSTIRPNWPRSTIAINALPWAEVHIDGERIGETPLGAVPVTIGPHEVLFRHPELGEQRHQIVVTLDQPARLSVDMRAR